jgi:hypothetical protein
MGLKYIYFLFQHSNKFWKILIVFYALVIIYDYIHYFHFYIETLNLNVM